MYGGAALQDLRCAHEALDGGVRGVGEFRHAVRALLSGGDALLCHGQLRLGASGARVLTTLIYALKDRGLKRGIATLCLGGGNGVALAIELP